MPKLWRTRTVLALYITLLVSALSLLFSCREGMISPSSRLYLLAASGVQPSSRPDALILFNTVTFAMKPVAHLLSATSMPETMARDPMGRIWIGYIGGALGWDNRVQVFDENGKAIKTIITLKNPRAIVFAGKNAVIACAQNGFEGALDVVDLDTLTRVKTIALPPPVGSRVHLLIAAAASDQRIVLAGITDGKNPDQRYALITVLDAKPLSVIWQSPPQEGVDIWSILAWRDFFLLLNVASAESGENSPADLLILRPDYSIDTVQIARSPLWAVLRQDTLYTFHNPTWNARSIVPQRTLATYHLVNKNVVLFPLPDRFDVKDIAIADDRLFLAHGSDNDISKQGIYSYDVSEKKLNLLVPIPSANKMLTGW